MATCMSGEKLVAEGVDLGVCLSYFLNTYHTLEHTPIQTHEC
jgi:hypothetical protein